MAPNTISIPPPTIGPEDSISNFLPQGTGFPTNNTDLGSVSAGQVPTRAQTASKLKVNEAIANLVKEWRAGFNGKNDDFDMINIIDDDQTKNIKDAIVGAYAAWDTLDEGLRKNVTTKRAISFSRLTYKDLIRMGVQYSFVESRDTIRNLVDRYNSARPGPRERAFIEALRAALKVFKNGAVTGPFSWIDELKVLSKHVGSATEAKSRIIIDRFISALTLIFLEAKKTIVTMPELTLGRSGSKSTSAVVVHKGCATILSGSVDYSYFLLEDSTELDKSGGFQTINTDAISDYVVEHGNGIVFVESKIRKDKATGGNASDPLKKHVPQVIGEAIGGIKAFNLEDRTKIAAIPWCISDGVDWKFGILYKRPESGWQNIAGPTFSFDLDPNADSTDSNIALIFEILETLIVWVTVKHDEILKEFEKAHRSTM